MSDVRVLHGDCVELMRAMPECSVDSIVTDPPYELGFMGKAWDGAGIAYSLDMWREALRVLKPGGHLLAFGGTRTYHRMACAIEDAGFEIRDSIHWVYGSGFPKSLNVGKAIDKAAGVEREVHGYESRHINRPETDSWDKSALPRKGFGLPGARQPGGLFPVTAPATDEARRWEGWGTALKPAHEPVVVARKPLSGTVAGNVLVWGTGGLNIDGCRVAPSGPPIPTITGKGTLGGTGDGWDRPWKNDPEQVAAREARAKSAIDKANLSGRWPANIVLDGAAAAALDQQSGERPGMKRTTLRRGATTGRSLGGENTFGAARPYYEDEVGYSDSGGASRFFTQADFGPDDWPFVYQAKPSKRERNAGLDGLPEKRREGTTPQAPGRQMHGQTDRMPAANHHPTVKPVALMRHLVRLVTPPGGTVLDPFAGSGTTLVAAVLEGMHAIGCEMTDEYLPIIRGRVAWAEQQADAEQPTLL
jgi:DNA modification methylase